MATLQLPAAELLRQSAAQRAQAHGIEHGLHAGRVCLAQQHQRQGHVALRHVQVRQYVKGLEHKPTWARRHRARAVSSKSASRVAVPLAAV